MRGEARGRPANVLQTLEGQVARHASAILRNGRALLAPPQGGRADADLVDRAFEEGLRAGSIIVRLLAPGHDFCEEMHVRGAHVECPEVVPGDKRLRHRHRRRALHRVHELAVPVEVHHVRLGSVRLRHDDGDVVPRRVPMQILRAHQGRAAVVPIQGDLPVVHAKLHVLVGDVPQRHVPTREQAHEDRDPPEGVSDLRHLLRVHLHPKLGGEGRPQHQCRRGHRRDEREGQRRLAARCAPAACGREPS
mmetsp:Transcript_4717/g.14219  ORF Transcript_4717/g.14219 Transcript_4717/m.14219 type:complete len:249 (-) Transcript_4717:37-783(-)